MLWCQIVLVSLYELQSVCLLGCDVYLLVRRIWLAKENIILDGCVEEHGLLHDVAALLTQGMRVIPFDSLVVDQDLARTLLNVIEAQ